MRVISTVPISELGLVRSHKNISDFAGMMVRLGALSPDKAVRVADVSNVSNIDRKGIYNRLARPGFVKVSNGPGTSYTYYYLFNDGFEELAKIQGETFYPINLAPLASTDEKIPRYVNTENVRYTVDTPEVFGTMSAPLPDAQPILIRAAGIDDAIILSGEVATKALPLIAEILKNPIGKDTTLDNALVLLSGIKRWLNKYNDDYDKEKQAYIREALESL